MMKLGDFSALVNSTYDSHAILYLTRNNLVKVIPSLITC